MGNRIKPTKEEFEEIRYGDGDWEEVDGGEWTQDHKYQHCDVVVKQISTGKTFMYSICRSGSPFTDWYYSYEDGDIPELYEVEKVKKVVEVESWECV